MHVKWCNYQKLHVMESSWCPRPTYSCAPSQPYWARCPWFVRETLALFRSACADTSGLIIQEEYVIQRPIRGTAAGCGTSTPGRWNGRRRNENGRMISWWQITCCYIQLHVIKTITLCYIHLHAITCNYTTCNYTLLHAITCVWNYIVLHVKTCHYM